MTNRYVCREDILNPRPGCLIFSVFANKGYEIIDSWPDSDCSDKVIFM